MADEHRVLIALWQLTSQERIVLIDAVTPADIVHASVHKGARLPAFAGAVGRCYAAYAGIGKNDARRKYDALRWENPPGFDAYWEDVLKAREQGYAFDFENLFGGLNLASSIACDRNGDPRFGVSTITISGQTTREALMRIAVDLKNAAELIEANIFGARRRLPEDGPDQRQPALQESGHA
jgi:DNA-binding IclR family transcriptional regulator